MTQAADRKGRRLSSDDQAVWDSVVRSIKPLRKRAPKVAAPPAEVTPAPPKAHPKKKTAAPVKAPVPVTPPKPAMPGPAALERRLKQKIARGSQTIDAKLDLHGHTQAEAHDALLRFLRRAQAKGCRVVLVITGKGGRGDGGAGGGVLKRQVPLWLALPDFRVLVIGYDQAAIPHGGEGALYVRLRKLRD
jgi:DNA-nicking Smr family endonuclease